MFSIFTPGCLGTNFLNQACLKIRNPPASASGIKGVSHYHPARIIFHRDTSEKAVVFSSVRTKFAWCIETIFEHNSNLTGGRKLSIKETAKTQMMLYSKLYSILNTSFWNDCIYLCRCVCMCVCVCVTMINKKHMNFKENNDSYMKRFGKRKGNEK